MAISIGRMWAVMPQGHLCKYIACLPPSPTLTCSSPAPAPSGRELNELVLCTVLVLKQQSPEGTGIRSGRGVRNRQRAELTS